MEKATQATTYTPKVDVIIIGAGLSGLMSAMKILQKERSLQVKILEATNVAGGQIGETRLGEIGGKWITEDQYHVYCLLQQLKLPTRRRTVLEPKLSRCWDIDRGFFSPLAKYELKRYLRELDLRMHCFRPGCYDSRKRGRSMHQHICNRLWFTKSRQFMLKLVQLICGVDACDIYLCEFMSICYSCGGLQMLIDLYLHCPNTLIEVSSTKLIQALLDRIKGADVLYWRKVYEVRHYKEFVEVVDSSMEVHTADAVILAVPWNSIQDITITPSMPMEMRKVPLPIEKSRLMMTSFMARYNDGHWRTAGYAGNFFSTEPLIVGHEYRPTTYAGVTVHEEGIEPLVRTIVLQSLAQHYGESMLLPCEFYQRTYEMSSMANVPFTTPWNRIVWSSSAAAGTCYRGCMGGAVQSGLRAAMNALLVVRPQTVTWQDIAEIQRCEVLPKCDVGFLTMWLSTWNLYNVSYYGVFLYTVFTALHYLNRKHIFYH